MAGLAASSVTFARTFSGMDEWYAHSESAFSKKGDAIMTTKRNMALAAIVALTALLVATTGWSVLGNLTPPPVLPGGVYTGLHAAPMGSDLSEPMPLTRSEPTVSSLGQTIPPTAPLRTTITESVTPLDPACNTMAFSYSCDSQDPTLACTRLPLAKADHLTDFVGNMVRTDWDTWDYTAVAYGTMEVPSRPTPLLVYIAVVQGTATYTADGNAKVAQGTVAVYAPEQDADGDGFPDEGETPVHHCGCTCPTQVVRLPVLSSL